MATLLNNPGSEDLVIDIWEGGSTLYGWDILNTCVDRLPLLVNESTCIKELGGEPVKTDITTEFHGMEEDVIKKLGTTDLSSFWPFKFVKKAYLPGSGWCNLFRRKISKIQSKRVFGEIKYIDPEAKELRVSWWKKLKYDSLLNTLPLDYLLKKLRNMEPVEDKLKSMPLFIGSLILRSRMNEVRIYYLGKKKFSSVAIVHLPLLTPGLQGFSIAYVIIPYIPCKNQGAFREKALSDAKKLGLLDKEPVSIRGYFEKYGILHGKVRGSAGLERYGITLAGRLGKWKELGICDVFKEVGTK